VILLAVLATSSVKAEGASTVALKTIQYREAVSFAIPVTWKEEDEPGVQGTFYEDRPDTGTLRVSVMQWVGSDEADRNRIAKSILSPGTVETLKQGVYLKKEVKDGSERGEALKLYRWLVVLALPENTCRLVVFTHTVTAAQEKEPAIVDELAVVEFAVRNAVFSYETTLPLLDTP
jgi:hypothetical protein